MAIAFLAWLVLQAGAAILTSYIIFLALLTIPAIQTQVIYLNKIKLTWFRDLAAPEQWGFLRNQVTPFTLTTSDGETIHAWHILPHQLYLKHQDELHQQPSGTFVDPDVLSSRLPFKLLRDDPDALLVLYFHGAAGTLASGYRPASYRALSAAAPDTKIHVVAIDYRGFGSSTGSPSEDGLLTDALTLADWATKQVGIPAERIVLFGQSLGTAVAISLAHHLAMNRHDPVLFAGMVLVAPFADVETLTATYRVAGVIPILGPLAYFPRLLAYLNTFIRDKWRSKDLLAAFIRDCVDTEGEGGKYHVTIIHAQDDYDIPWTHSEQLFRHAVNATARAGGVGDEWFGKLRGIKMRETGRRIQFLPTGSDSEGGGWVVHYEDENGGVIRKEITKRGLHDRIMSYPIVGEAVLRAFRQGGSR